jgi:hypothetical protein
MVFSKNNKHFKHWNELINNDFEKDGKLVIFEKSLYNALDTRKNKVIHTFFLTIVGFLDFSFNDNINIEKSTIKYAIFMNYYIII